MRKILLVLSFATICPVQSLLADDAGKKAQIEELLGLLNIDKMTEQALAQLPQQIKSMAPSGDPAVAQAFLEKMTPIIQERMSYAKLKPEYVRIYSEVLTEDEVSASLRFYKSPEGQSLLKKMPQLMNRSMEVGQKAFADLMPDIQRVMEELKEQRGAGKK
jgi:uncharacterized protein